MKAKDNSIFLFLGIFILFALVAATPYITGNVIYAQRAGSTCFDTDGGVDYYAPGTAGGLADHCESDTSNLILIEHSCGPYGNVISERHTCTGDYTCFEGACRIGEGICYDTDDGRFIYGKGTVTRAGLDYVDVCNNDISIKEYSCNAVNEVEESISNCPYGCEDGACITRRAAS